MPIVVMGAHGPTVLGEDETAAMVSDAGPDEVEPVVTYSVAELTAEDVRRPGVTRRKRRAET